MLDMIHYKNSLLQNFNGNYYVQRNLPRIPAVKWPGQTV
jgi:hypothetical protein